MPDKEAPLIIWAALDETRYLTRDFKNKDDIKYVRADHYYACMEAGCSLNYHLFKLTDALLNRPDVGEREIADTIDDAQLALDKWNRFLDGN